jgi:zinc protease
MRRLLLVALTLASSVRAGAQRNAGFPASPPPLAAPKPFVAPRVHERRLSNGLETSLVPFGSAPLTFIQLTIGAGKLNDPTKGHGLASITGSYLREGTRTLDRRTINLAGSTLGLIGGDVSISVGNAETTISARVLSDSAPGLLRLIASLVREPSFPPDALERIARAEARQAAGRATQMEARALDIADSVLFGDPALSSATDNSVARLTLDDVRRFWAASYSPRNAALYVAGVFDQAAVRKEIDRSFGDWSGGPALAVRSSLEANDVAAPVIHFIDRPGASQARVMVAYRIVDPGASEYLTLNQLSIVMGSVQTSRITRNVRETHGYSYNIATWLSARPGSSKWIVSGDVVNASTGAALKEILAEVARVRETPLTQQELLGFQRFMAGVLVTENSTPDGIVSTLARQRLFHMDRSYLGSFVERIYAVTPEDIRGVAQRYLDARQAAIIVIGDRASVEAQLSGVVARSSP